MITYNEQKKTKLRFLAVYAVSLILIFIVVVAFWQKKSAITDDSITQQAEGETYFLQFDTLLYSKLDQVDNMFTLFLKAPEKSTVETNHFFSVKNAMTTTLDSIAEQASILNTGPKKAAMEMIVNRYRSSLEIRDRLISQLSFIPKDKVLSQPQVSYTDTSRSNTDIQSLRNTVAEKEQRITTLEQKAQADLKEKDDLINSLQIQLKQKLPGDIPNNSPMADNAWKQKYASLKASYDKVAESEKALRNAYKTVAEDNRRLLSELQSMKKG